MTAPGAISFDEVLGLLRGPAVQEFETRYAASRGYTVSPNWGDSQNLAKELGFVEATRTCLEAVLGPQRELLASYIDARLALAGSEDEEWPEGEEPDEGPRTIASEAPVKLGRGFSIMAACELWVLTGRGEPELVDWLKFRRIPNHRQYATQLRRIFLECSA